MQGHIVWDRSIFNLAMIGASVLFVIPLRAVASSLRIFLLCGLCVIVLGVVLFLFVPQEAGEVPRRTALAFLGAMGILSLGLASVELYRWWLNGKHRAFIVLCGGWMLIVVAYNIIVLPFGSARYLLPLFPMLFLVLLHGVDLSIKRLRWVMPILLCFSVIWGGAQAWADYYYAGTYRSMAREIATIRQNAAEERAVWYIGEWGMRHYFDQAGARYLTADSLEPRSGDLLIIPEMVRLWGPHQRLQPRLHIYERREFRSPLPLRLFNDRSGAGFYCHHWGLLPFALSTEPDEVFLIVSVQ